MEELNKNQKDTAQEQENEETLENIEEDTTNNTNDINNAEVEESKVINEDENKDDFNKNFLNDNDSQVSKGMNKGKEKTEEIKDEVKAQICPILYIAKRYIAVDFKGFGIQVDLDGIKIDENAKEIELEYQSSIGNPQLIFFECNK